MGDHEGHKRGIMLSAFLKRLMFARQFNIDNGKIEILGCDNIMLSSEFFIQLQEMTNDKAYELAKEPTRQLIERYFKKIGSDQTRSNETVEGIFNNFGLGRLQVVETRSDRTVVNIHNSTLAEKHVKAKGYADSCICTLTAGVLAGMFSFLLKKDLNSEEVDCIAKGNPACKFIIK